MNKIGAMVRYEVLMAWRRRSLPILVLVLVTISFAFSLLAAQQAEQHTLYIDPTMRALAAANHMDIDVVYRTITEINHLTLLLTVFNIAMFLICAETIPLDRQFRVRELLDALPISRAVYLCGKVLGVWSGLALVLLVGGAVSLVIQRMIFGDSDSRVIALLWVVVALPVCGMSGAASVLATSFLGSRRLAVLINLFLLPVLMVLGLTTTVKLVYASGLVAPVYLQSVTLSPPSESVVTEISTNVFSALALIVGVTTAAWGAAWAWARWREAR